MACADACRHGALAMSLRADGHWYPEVNAAACVGCGLCERACPARNGLAYGSTDGKSVPLAAWATDKDLIRRSASGGVFAAVTLYVLSTGGYVAGAVSAGREVRHIVTNKTEDLPLLQGTKYLQSDTRGAYRDVKRLLALGETVLFSGTGCQVGGLLQYLGKAYDNLFTIDLICAGVPSSLVMSRYCEEEKISPKSIRWRDKENGWKHGLQLTVTTEKGQYKPETAGCFFGGGFLGGMTARWSCYNCRFTGTDRLSDFTIGDYWGAPKTFEPQWHDGVSVLVVHTEKGKALLAECGVETKSTTWRESVRCNPRILLGTRPLSWANWERRLLSWNFRHLSYATLKKLYASNIRKNDVLWLPYKVFKFLRWRIAQSLTTRRVNKILKTL